MTLPVPAIVALGFALLAAPPPQPPTLEDVLSRAASYAADYGRRMNPVAADVEANEVLRGFGVESSDLPGVEAAGETAVRLMRGTIVLVSTSAAFRDFHEVNGKRLHDRGDRLEALFADGSQGALAEARTIARENRALHVGSVARVLNIPALALGFLLPETQARFAFKKAGEKSVGRERVWVVRYDEVKTPSLIVTSEGDEYPAHGEMWIEPGTGRVVRTQMIVENLARASGSRTDTEKFRVRISIEVTYRVDPALGTWVPAEMKEIYDKQAERVTSTEKYARFRLVTARQRP